MPRPWRAAGRPGGTSAVEAARTLDELRAITDRSRRTARAAFTGVPLLAWGVAWMAGYAGLGLLPWATAVPLGLALSACAVLVTVLVRSTEIVSESRGRIAASWVALMVSSPLLAATVAPVPVPTMLVFLGALWGVGLLLLAVGTSDAPLGVVGGIVVAVAASAHVLLGDRSLLVFGLVAGGAMAGLGAVRTCRS